MDRFQNIFRRKRVMTDTLEPFGFLHTDSGYVFTRELTGSGFAMTVTLTDDGTISTIVTDPAFDEPYTLHLTNDAVGEFVGKVRSEYEKLLIEIAEKCFAPDVFKTAQSKELIDYIHENYGDALEFLWEKFPDNAVWRRKDTGKWYGALLTVSKRKLGLKSDEIVEIIDLRMPLENREAPIDNKRYFPGWHMNKKNWYTIILDGSVALEELHRRIEESYLLATK